tara:strand:+ start:2784 stop:6941 length:4158 start_codon:yes stop_codon:yes gene_type:complete
VKIGQGDDAATARGLKVRVDFILTETMSPQSNGWLWDEAQNKYLKIGMLLITDQAVGDKLFAMVGAQHKTTPDQLVGDLMSSLMSSTPNSSNHVVKIIDISENMLVPNFAGTGPGDHVPDKTTNPNGSVTYRIPFTKEFEIQSANPDHLTLLACPFVDYDGAAEDMGMAYGSMGANKGEQVTIENYINHGQLNSRAVVYFTETNPSYIWTGAASFYSAGAPSPAGNVGWVGQGPAGKEVKLNREIINNNKIQDFRVREEIEKRRFDATSIDIHLDQQEAFRKLSSLKNVPGQARSAVRAISGKEPAFFSDIMISRDSVNNCRFMFSMDHRRIIEEKATFGKIFQVEALEKHVRIRSLKILRKRVDPTSLNSNLPNKSDWKDFDSELPVETIVVSKEHIGNEVSTLSMAQSSTGNAEVGLKRRALFYEEELTTPSLLRRPSRSGVRHFCVEDYEVSEMSDGHYQYGVEIVLEDNSAKLIQNDIIRLRKVLKHFNNYYEMAKIPEKKEVVSTIRGSRKTKVTPGNYDEGTNGFTDRFVSAQSSAWSDGHMAKSFQTYFDVLKNFKLGASLPADQLQERLISIVSPETGTPEGISYFIGMIGETLIELEKLSNYGKSSLKYRRDHGQTIGEGVSFMEQPSTNVKKTIEMQNFFYSTYDVNISKLYGCDYLTTWTGKDNPRPSFASGEGEILGFKTITVGRYRNRCKKEIAKYFTKAGRSRAYNEYGNPAPGPNAESLTFFSPASILLPTLDGAHNLVTGVSSPTPLAAASRKKQLNNGIERDKYNIFKASMVRNHLRESVVVDPHDELDAKPSRGKGRKVMKGSKLFLRKRLEASLAARGCLVEREETIIDSLAEQGVTGHKELVDALGDSGIKDPDDIKDEFREARRINDTVNPNFTLLSLMAPKTGDSEFLEKFSYENVISTVQDYISWVAGSEVGPATAASEVRMNAPVQLKSLMIDASPETTMTPAQRSRNLAVSWRNNKADIYSNPKLRSIFEIDYLMLGKVERFVGYRNGDLQAPMWAPIRSLSPGLLGKDGKILCRVKSIQNTAAASKWGLDELGPEFDIPVYNEHFFLTTKARFDEDLGHLYALRGVEVDKLVRAYRDAAPRRPSLKTKTKMKKKHSRSRPSASRMISLDFRKKVKTNMELDKKALGIAVMRKLKYGKVSAGKVKTTANQLKIGKKVKARRYSPKDPLAHVSSKLSKKQIDAMRVSSQEYRNLALSSSPILAARDKNIIKTQFMGNEAVSTPEKFILSGDGLLVKRTYPGKVPKAIPKSLPIDYRESELDEQNCGNCSYMKAGHFCSLWDAYVKHGYLCDSWDRPSAASTKSTYANVYLPIKAIGRATEKLKPVPPTKKKKAKKRMVISKPRLRSKGVRASKKGKGSGGY